MKPTLDQLALVFKFAEAASEFSSDAEKQVGAALLGETIELTSSNEFIDGAKGLPNTRPDKYEYIVHAEVNLVCAAAREGIVTEGKTVVCTLSPCQNCIRTMFQAGIRDIYYKETYRAHDPNMRDIKVTEKPYGEYIHMSLTNYEN